MNGQELTPFDGELVLVPCRRVVILPTLEDLDLDKPLQSLREDFAGDPQLSLEIVETARSETPECDDLEVPRAPEDVHRALASPSRGDRSSSFAPGSRWVEVAMAQAPR